MNEDYLFFFLSNTFPESTVTYLINVVNYFD